MTFGQRLALNFAPLLLRLGLAFIFIYAGAAKLFYADMPVQGEAAAYLANAGLIKAPPRPAIPMPTESPKDKAGNGAVYRAPEGAGLVVIEAQLALPKGPEPAKDKDATPADTKPTDTPAGAKPDAATPEKAPAAGEPPKAEAPAPADVKPEAKATSPAPKYAASDFTEPVKVRRLLALVLLMHSASEEGHWPKQLSSPTALRVLAWMAALTEFLGGWLVLLGFLTRVWALGFVSTMCVAMWLTQIAPNIGAEHALLGFLPPLQIADAANAGSWQTWQFQTIILLSSLALALIGPGKASLDAMLFHRPDPAPPPPSKPNQDRA